MAHYIGKRVAVPFIIDDGSVKLFEGTVQSYDEEKEDPWTILYDDF